MLNLYVKMNIPETFKPESKNLEDNTKRLEEELPKVIGESELEQVLKTFDNKPGLADSKFEKLIERSEYQLQKESPGYQYWGKQGYSVGETFLMVRYPAPKGKNRNKRYALAILEDPNLEKFYKKFEKHISNKLSHEKTCFYNIANFLKGAITGGIMGSYAGLKMPFRDPVLGIVLVIFVGLIGFFGVGALTDYTLHEANKGDLEYCCKGLIFNDKKAIQKAFS